MPANLENSAVATELEKVSFHSNPKDRQCQKMLKLPHNCNSHTSKVMLKIIQARLQQHVSHELPDVQTRFRKGRGTKLSTSIGLLKKQQSSRKTSISALLTMPKPLCGTQQTVENSSREGNTRPPYLPPEKPVCR